MELLTLQEAADFLGWHYETVRRKAVSGEIPGTKLGHWRFFKEDLVKAIRSQYATPALRGEEAKCSAKSEDQVSTILDSQHQTAAAYAALLGPKTENSPKNTKTSSKKRFGGRTG